MRLPLALVRTICRLLVGVMLFAQMAIAAHACDGPAAMRAAQVEALTMEASMPADCDMAMPEAPVKSALCSDHCRSGDQSADTASVPTPAAVPVLLYALPQLDSTAAAALASAARPSTVAAAPPPSPHTVTHCVWRI